MTTTRRLLRQPLAVDYLAKLKVQMVGTAGKKWVLHRRIRKFDTNLDSTVVKHILEYCCTRESLHSSACNGGKWLSSSSEWWL
jgi:hypothetical protein